jgi:hypothetical protein
MNDSDSLLHEFTTTVNPGPPTHTNVSFVVFVPSFEKESETPYKPINIYMMDCI